MKSIIKGLLVFSAVCCVGAGLALRKTDAAAESVVANTIDATITEINNENLDGGLAFAMVLSANDYITAEMVRDEYGNITNYKWVNAEEISDRCSVDFANQNVANAQLDQNLAEYNFEDYIFFDGVSLAEFSKANAYKLFANKRTRMNTFSIDFASANVLKNVELVEIKEGCQIPTMQYAYRGVGDFSCIEIQETVTYENKDGKWLEYFPGYEEGIEYACDENNFELTMGSAYKGHTAVPLNSYTDFFTKYDVQGELLKHKVLVSASNTKMFHNRMISQFWF